MRKPLRPQGRGRQNLSPKPKFVEVRMGDHFSKQSAAYKKFRPTYPQSLFAYLASLCSEKKLAWDCATGSGQAANDLAAYFELVLATDISENQLKLAQQNPRIDYRVSTAESCAHLKSSSCDLVTVAQAYHWLDEIKFLAEAQRVLKPGGILAIWNYDWATIEPSIDEVLNAYGKGLLASYWPPDVQKRAKPDRISPEGFEILKAPSFNLEVDWDFNQLRGYLDSWSATQMYKDKNQRDPFSDTESQLRERWGSADTVRKVIWPLHFLLARKNC